MRRACNAGVLAGRFEKLSLPEQALTLLSLLSVALWVFPQAAAAQAAGASESKRLAFEIKLENLQSTLDATAARDIPGTKVYILKNYLESKNSPLVDHVETLLLQPNWKVVLSISHAESNMCKYTLGNNCWGIGGAKYHRYYPTFAEGIVDASALIEKYHDGGLTTPKTMMRRWVGWNNQSWIAANNLVLSQIQALGI
ncbi:MAG: hypothetical protein M1275_00680 [Patescibacteria group bacterium]|nr:hypothetical protein [Patescibacteria group bacterium]